jgi:hypothetical protein
VDNDPDLVTLLAIEVIQIGASENCGIACIEEMLNFVPKPRSPTRGNLTLYNIARAKLPDVE